MKEKFKDEILTLTAEAVEKAYEIGLLVGARAEREACAKLCEDEAWRLKQIALDTESETTNTRAVQAFNDAVAIRARGKQ